MPRYRITHNKTGQELVVEGPRIPTESQIDEMFDRYNKAKYGDPFTGPIKDDPLSLIPGMDQTAQPAQPEERSMMDTLKGAGEAALTTATGATSGALGMIGGTLGGIAGQIATGEFGTREGADRAQSVAMQSASDLTYEPRTEAGQEMVETIGEVSQAAAPLAGLAPQTQVLGNLAKGAGVAAKSAVSNVAPGAAAAMTKAAKPIFKHLTPTKQKLLEKIEAGSTEMDTAKYKLGTSKLTGKKKVVADTFAKDAIKQGFDEGSIAAIKNQSKHNKKLMAEMAAIDDKARKDTRFGMTNRATDVAGREFKKQIDIVDKVRRDAGNKLDTVVKGLSGKKVKQGPAIDTFLNKLNDMDIGVERNKNGILVGNFDKSLVPAGDKGPINKIIKGIDQFNQSGGDALTAHKLKRAIDKNVSYGSVKTGMSGEATHALKSLRTSLDQALDSEFTDYAKANSVYREAISARQQVDDAIGMIRKSTGETQEKGLGNVLRRTMSNAQSRAELLDSIDSIGKVAEKYYPAPKGKGVDVLTLSLFADELDKVFGPQARTGFASQVGRGASQAIDAMPRSATDLAISGVKAVADKVTAKTPEKAFEAINKLLKVF